MCCFSRRIEEVSGTSIFARFGGDRQLLAYQMRLSSPEDVAMILPLPTAPGHGEEAVELIDLSRAPGLFEELSKCFSLYASFTFGGQFAARSRTLAVHRVGAYEASFVPSVADFARLDPRFRLPDAVLGGMAAYRDYGFAVFKLRKGEGEVHPLALRFTPRTTDKLFYPTVHVHDGDLPDLAEFDHTLYLQSADFEPADWEKAPLAVGTVLKLGDAPAESPTRGLVDSGWPLFRRRIQGTQRNRDTWVPLAKL
jgi:hypothetical protein